VNKFVSGGVVQVRIVH